MPWSVSFLIRLSSSSGFSYVVKSDWWTIVHYREQVWRMKAILCNFDDNKDIKLWFGQSNLAVVYCHHTNTSDFYFGRSSRVESGVHTTIQQPQATTFVCRALTMQDYGQGVAWLRVWLIETKKLRFSWRSNECFIHQKKVFDLRVLSAATTRCVYRVSTSSIAT